MTCFQCGRGQLLPSRVSLTSNRHGESFTVEVDGFKCEACGFQTVDSEQSAEFTRLVSDAYRTAHGRLTSKEIRARRTQLGMSQMHFGEYLGTGPASVKRWELGQVQDKAMDELIRLKTDPEAARKNLRALEQQVPEQMVLSETEDVTLTLTMSDRGQYGHRPAMTMEAVAIAGEFLEVGDLIAA
jgi:putative zinc finger/helix-turn-helix YgiT family protein